jgi:hypothetical protein
VESVECTTCIVGERMTSVVASGQSSAGNTLQTLASYGAKAGVYAFGIKPAVFPGSGRGFRVKQNVAEGTKVLSVPNKLLMNHKTARADAGLRAFFDVVESNNRFLTPETILSLHLLYERAKGPASKFERFISTMPLHYTTPPFWNQAVFNALHRDDERLEAQRLKEAVSNKYGTVKAAISKHLQLLPAFQGAGVPTYEDFAWAHGTVMTRSMFIDYGDFPEDAHDEYKRSQGEVYQPYMPFTDKRPCYTLVPLADLFNHTNIGCRSRFNSATKCYEFFAPVDLKKGSEMFLCYGHYNNWQLLSQYGFVLPGNRYDSFPVTIAELGSCCDSAVFPMSKAQVECVKKELARNGMYKPQLASLLSGEGGDGGTVLSIGSWGMVFVLRVMHGGANEKEISLSAREASQSLPISLNSGINEAKAIASIGRLLKNRLEKLKETKSSWTALEKGSSVAIAESLHAVHFHVEEREKMLLSMLQIVAEM